MGQLISLGVVIILLTHLLILCSNRLGHVIRVYAFQTFVLSVLPALVVVRDVGLMQLLKFEPQQHKVWLHLIILSLGSLLVKGVVVPAILLRTVRELSIPHQIKPLVSFGVSLGFGAATIILSLLISSALVLPQQAPSILLVPGSFASIMIGLFIMVSRRKAILQILGYLLIENGVFLFGLLLIEAEPVLVEIGVLLDIFVAVFIMGVIVYHIDKSFDHIESWKLSSLREP